LIKIFTGIIGIIAAILLIYCTYAIGEYTQEAPDVSVLARE